jgi:hypothetical protein
MKRKITIEYQWYMYDRAQEVKDSHIEALEESAREKIALALEGGFFGMFNSEGKEEGRMFDNIYMDDDDPEEGIEYYGRWTLETHEES